MRPWLVLPVVVLFALAPDAVAQSTGGAVDASQAGGAEYGASAGKERKRPARPRRAKLRATHFAVQPRTLTPGGAPAAFSYRVDGSAARVRVRIEIVAPGARSAAARIRLGWKPTGVRRVHRWSAPAGSLAPGRYAVRLHAVDDAGRRLARSASASGRTTVRVTEPPAPRPVSGVFPVQGSWSYGGDDARFGAGRGTRSHQGQDLTAPSGTPVVSPRAGQVYFRAFEESGGGHYLVVRDAGGRDYVFMHLLAGSLLVGKGDAVRAGQQIAEVGSSGRSSGAHLHFEIWPCGWYAKGCSPIDPRPELEAWATASRS